MARAEHLHFFLRPQHGANLLDRCGFVHVIRTVGEVPRPIGELLRLAELLLRGPGGKGREEGPRDRGREEIEEGPFIHVRSGMISNQPGLVRVFGGRGNNEFGLGGRFGALGP